MKKYFYKLMARYFSLFIRPEDTVIEVKPHSGYFATKLSKYSVLDGAATLAEKPEYILINGNIHYERDIQAFLEKMHNACGPSTRLLITYYSMLWKPLLKLASFLGFREKDSELNWVSHEDVVNLLALADYEVVCLESKVLIPIWLPVLSDFLNRYIAPLPFFRSFNMVNILLARPVRQREEKPRPSVSVLVPARNEAGNIEAIFSRVPRMGPDDELIFVEGHSTDDTWEKIMEAKERFKETRNVIIAQQDGKGKGDAVRKGFGLATKDILMILDADMTVPPEDLPKFYQAIVRGKGEFINGSRLVYPMEKEAMRFFNLLGNKFFALAFSFVLGQNFKDTLCGTKVLSKRNYCKLAQNRAYFGNFDPFGDFDLIFGAARMGLKIVELPITYRQRTYGTTNIERWKHGMILLRMLVFAARKIRFI